MDAKDAKAPEDKRAKVLIIDPATGDVVAACHGAGDYGTCPLAVEGHPVPCAGHRLLPVANSGLEGWTMTVMPDAEGSCPLAFLPVRDVA